MNDSGSSSPEFNSKKWFQTAFAWTGTALPLCYFRILLMTLYSAIVQLLYTLETSAIVAFSKATSPNGVDSFGHVVLGSLIGFLLVMRMNASNARFWEGRSHWGSIINFFFNDTATTEIYTQDGQRLAELVAGYAVTLKQSLHGQRYLDESTPFLPKAVVDLANEFGNQPTAVAGAITAWVRRQSEAKVLDPEMTRHMESLTAELVNSQGGCEKIQKTPLPFAYVSLIKLLILVYLVTLPIVLCSRFGWWAPLLTAVLSLGMFGMEETSIEIEDPFGKNLNCIDLDVLTITIARDTGQLARKAPRLQTLLATDADVDTNAEGSSA